MLKTKAIFFDFDGTLADTAPVITGTMRRTFSALGKAVPGDEAMRATIGLPLWQALRDVGSLRPDEVEPAVTLYRRLFPSDGGAVTLFPGVAATLRSLREAGLTLAVCTSREESSLRNILRANGVEECFTQFVTNTDGLPPKPAPAMVVELLRRLSLTPGEAVVVGDTTYDLLMGAGAGCRTVAVTYGNHPLPRLLTARPTHTIDHFAELAALVS